MECNSCSGTNSEVVTCAEGITRLSVLYRNFDFLFLFVHAFVMHVLYATTCKKIAYFSAHLCKHKSGNLVIYLDSNSSNSELNTNFQHPVRLIPG